MKITDLQIDGFGVWSDLNLEHLTDSMTVFYGPNEAGKTTLMQFIRCVLYGYSPERRRATCLQLVEDEPAGRWG